MIKNSYKQIVVRSPGDTDVLEIQKRQIPVPKSNEVLIRIARAGVAFGDVIKRSGYLVSKKNYPLTPGYDIAGYIDNIGSAITDFSIGDKVLAFSFQNGYSQYITVASTRVVKIYDSMDLTDAVCLVLNYLTTYQMMYRVAKIKKGNKVLIHSAAGGVGTALLQLGSYFGLKMYGTASSSKHKIIEELNGIPIDYRDIDFVSFIKKIEPEGLDIVFDAISLKNGFKSILVLKRTGKLINFGFLGAFKSNNGLFTIIRQMISLKLLKRKKKIFFYQINPDKYPDWYKEDILTLIDLYKNKMIKPIVFKVIPLEDVQLAHKFLTQGKVFGKIVLDCV